MERPAAGGPKGKNPAGETLACTSLSAALYPAAGCWYGACTIAAGMELGRTATPALTLLRTSLLARSGGRACELGS